MAALRDWRARSLERLERCLPSTLRGRLALLLFVVVIASHVLALTLVFELGPAPLLESQEHRSALAVFWQSPVPALDVGIRLAALMGAAWWGARWVSRPLQRLVAAARELGADIHRPALPEDGTTECREASRVFNQMQARIRQQLADRDRFVAGVSHDLRTPLTRLRLRAESIADEEERERFSRDIQEMDAMITVTLDHLRGVAHGEPMALLDIQALLESLVDDEQACGHAVTLAGAAGPIPAQAVALRRCVGNLIGNAVRYGQVAEVTLRDSGEAVHIDVRDRGPGLPPDELLRVRQPFYRAEGARQQARSGAGLGLAIVDDIVQRHRGRLTLRNAPEGGLIASLVLPRSAAAMGGGQPSTA